MPANLTFLQNLAAVARSVAACAAAIVVFVVFVVFNPDGAAETAPPERDITSTLKLSLQIRILCTLSPREDVDAYSDVAALRVVSVTGDVGN